jgi:hypothetical protein
MAHIPAHSVGDDSGASVLRRIPVSRELVSRGIAQSTSAAVQSKAELQHILREGDLEKAGAKRWQMLDGSLLY